MGKQTRQVVSSLRPGHTNVMKWGGIMKSCLFVVDVQNGFVSDKTKYVIDRIKKLLRDDLFDFVLFTKFINNTDSPYRRILHWNRLSTNAEQEIVSDLVPFAENVFNKEVYSGVNKFTLDFIRENNIEKVFILGIDTDCCVLKTAVDLFEINIHPVILEYYSASNGGSESHLSALRVLGRLIGKPNIIEGEIDETTLNIYKITSE